jgi:hypothetical protein
MRGRGHPRRSRPGNGVVAQERRIVSTREHRAVAVQER